MESIRITLSDSRKTEAQEIELVCIILQYADVSTPETMANSENNLINYLEELGVTYYVITQGKVDAGDKIAAPHQYKVILDAKSYPPFEQFLNDNQDIAAIPKTATFFEKDRERVMLELGSQAAMQATEIAASQGKTISEEYDVQELEVKQSGWVIYPPLSYKWNYMIMPMELKFEFTFRME